MSTKLQELMDDCGFYIDPHDSNATKKEVKFLCEMLISKCIELVLSTETGYRDYRNQIEESMRSACADSISDYFKE